MKCPSCERGDLIENKCARCGVVIARGAEPATPVFAKRPWRCKQDQDTVGPYTDMARLREDRRG